MADRSPIQWTEATWNPVRGCSRVSEGCRHCYAEQIAARFSGPGKPFAGFATRRSNGEAAWTGKVALVPELLTLPLRWRKPRRVFVNSMSDLFHESLPFRQIMAVFGVMAQARQHTFQVLTKRPGRMRAFFELLEADAGEYDPPIATRCGIEAVNYGAMEVDELGLADVPWPLPNVWLGTSVEDQATADERIPLLLQTPAAVRFISAEPLLGDVNLATVGERPCFNALSGHIYGMNHNPSAPRLDWVIVGGESGRGARPCDVAWIRSIVAQCRAAGVACFVKQLGAYAYFDTRNDRVISGWRRALHDRKGGDPSEWPEDLRVREFPGAAA